MVYLATAIKMKCQLVIFCVFIVSSTVFAIEVDKCSDDIPGAVDFVSEGCDSLPCPLIRGATSNSNITFRIPAATTTSTIKIDAHLTGFWVPFPLTDQNTCNNLINSFCPLEENEIVTYHLAIEILKQYPKLSMDLRIQFLDEKAKAMMCVEVPVIIVDPPSL